MPKQQRARAHKESKGIHGGARKVRLTEVEKVLISRGGSLAAISHRKSKRALKHYIAKGHDPAAV